MCRGFAMITPLQAQWLTIAFVVAATGIILGFDAWVIARFGADASISRVFGRLFGLWPSVLLAVVFWLGVLVGHIWLPAR
jgi:hypothetical protein